MERVMTEPDTTTSWQSLSALADGEVDAGAAASLAAAWRDDAALRRRWHAYHLIGDALRSDELAAGAGDAAFLRRLRERLEREPVVLAPAALERPAALAAPIAVGAHGRARPVRLRRWGPPAAVAAGFVVVAGALTVLRTPGEPAAPDAVAPQLALAPQAPAPQAAVPVVAAAAPQLVGPVVPEELAQRNEPAYVLVRDARIDEYLAAHKQFGGSTALGVPSGFLRSATYEGPAGAVPASR
jgi:sigma-E factor negative regulatory protein RseA